MTKADIAKLVWEQVGGFSKREAADLVDLVFETMKETIGRGEKVKVPGFGNFVPHDTPPRPGRNPKTGQVVPIADRRVLKFRPSPRLNEVLNAPNDEIGTSSR
jgi:integration host factor subunit alpha